MTAHSDQATRLSRWFKTHAIQLHPALELRKDANTGLGLYSTSPLTGDNRILSVPANICISSPSARLAISTVFPSPSSSLDLPRDQWAIFYIFLVRLLSLASPPQQEGQGGLYDHLGYVEALPTSIPIPLLFRPSELHLLKGTPLHGATIEKLCQTAQEFETVHAWLQRQRASVVEGTLAALIFTSLDRLDSSRTATYHPALKLYRWSNAVSLSRAFPPTLLPGLSSDDGPVLIPGLDLPNHARGKAVTWSSTSTSPDAHVILTTRYPVEQHGEILNNYGPKSNEELLGSYAFVLPEGEDDFLSLKLGQETEAGSDAGSKEDSSTEAGTYRWLRKVDAPPAGLLEEIRARIAQSAPSPPPNDDIEKSPEVKELQEQGETFETLEILLVRKRKAFKLVEKEIEASLQYVPLDEILGGNDDETNAPVRRGVWEMTSFYRHGQLAILNQAIKWTRAKLESVADRLDQLDPADKQDQHDQQA